MMKLYDPILRELLAGLETYPVRRLNKEKGSSWKDAGREAMILRSDMAYELGKGTLPALGSTILTMDKELVPEDEILLYGEDLKEIRKDRPYARIAAVRMKQGSLGEGNELYNEVRKTEYTRYRLFPEGFMMRVSAFQEREAVRVGRQALEKGLGFAQVGSMFLTAYHRNPKVEAVKLIFITRKEFPWPELGGYIRKAEQITRAIDHVLKNLSMDCNACSLKQICDEVEGLKELHRAPSENGTCIR